MKAEDSLEQVLREDNTPNSLPIVTIDSLGGIKFCPIVQCDLMLSENCDEL